ncbi:restriction endonuclease subunit S [Streptococcus suis]|nr:restriction endonuclease subunit S [Streptococcus suis]
MPNKDKNIPKRRFKAFENADAWELRKLGDTVIEIIAGGDIDKNKVVEFGKYPIYANSHSGDGIVGYYDDFYRVNGPAVTVTGRGEVGFAKARETDFTPVVRLLAIRSKHNHYFLENAINLHGVTVESTGVPQLTVPQLSAYRIYFPFDIQEENQIGTFFSTLDRHITLHQRKLDKLKSVKQAYLSEMFPAEGERVPKRRFPGFTDDWELRKLGEVAEINPKSQVPETFEYVDLESVVGTNLISHRTESINSAPSRAQRLALYGDIFYQTVRPYQKNNYLFDLPYKNYVFSTGYAQLRPKIDSRYLMIKIQVDGFVKEVLDRCTGTSYPAINSKDLSQISIDVPVSLPEQEAIGTFFSTLDRQITLHQRKLEKLKNLKKALLNELFVDFQRK